MIHELSGDLLLSQADLIAHGVAPNDDFKHGIALALREACPAMYKDFRHYCRAQNPKPGTLWLWQGVDPNGRHVRLCALFTQEPASREGGHAGAAADPGATRRAEDPAARLHGPQARRRDEGTAGGEGRELTGPVAYPAG